MRSAEESTQEIVAPLLSAGISGVVFDRSDEELASAIADVQLHAFPADVFSEDGALLFVLAETAPSFAGNELSDWLGAIDGLDCAAIANHPYDRSQGRPWGDRVYRLRGVSALATTTWEAAASRDKLAQTAAKKLGTNNLGGSFGNSEALGHIATLFEMNNTDLPGLIAAIRSKQSLVCRLESADTEYQPLVEPKPTPSGPRDNHRSRRGSQRDSGGRGRGRGPRR